MHLRNLSSKEKFLCYTFIEIICPELFTPCTFPELASPFLFYYLYSVGRASSVQTCIESWDSRYHLLLIGNNTFSVDNVASSSKVRVVRINSKMFFTVQRDSFAKDRIVNGEQFSLLPKCRAMHIQSVNFMMLAIASRNVLRSTSTIKITVGEIMIY